MAYAIVDSKDGITFTGARTANTPVFTLLGGKYMVGVTAPSTSATLNVLLPDGATYIAVGTTTSFTAAGTTSVDLTRGTYELVFVATGDVAGFVQKIPYNARG